MRTLPGSVWMLSFPLCLVTPVMAADEEPSGGVETTLTTTTDDPRREVHLDFFTEPMPRNASLAMAGQRGREPGPGAGGRTSAGPDPGETRRVGASPRGPHGCCGSTCLCRAWGTP
jgi:hypothetical protein